MDRYVPGEPGPAIADRGSRFNIPGATRLCVVREVGVDLVDQTVPSQRLSHITTLWSLVRQAHDGAGEMVSKAQCRLMERYGGAVHCYLLGALRSPEAADELFQEFSLRFLQGAFRNANPERGRFRDFLKTSVYHLIVDYQRQLRLPSRPLSLQTDELAVSAPDLTKSDQEFLASWREQLIDRTWQALAAREQETGVPYYTILQFRTHQPMLSSAELADQLGTRLGKRDPVDGIRQTLHRARDKFTDLLLEEIVQSLEDPPRAPGRRVDGPGPADLLSFSPGTALPTVADCRAVLGWRFSVKASCFAIGSYKRHSDCGAAEGLNTSGERTGTGLNRKPQVL